jgi:uncharacterized protein (DUF58 family)
MTRTRTRRSDTGGGPRLTVSPLGLCVVGLCLIALVVPRPERDGIDPRPLIGVALVLTLLVDAAFAWRSGPVRAHIDCPSVLRVGETGEIRVTAERAAWGWPRVRLLGTHDLTGGEARIPLSARARGLYRLADARFERPGPFGLVRATMRREGDAAPLERIVCIGPAREPGVALPVGASIVGDPDDTPERLRAYAPGDDVRRIAWRPSARTEDLLVLESQRQTTSTRIAVDLGPLPGARAEHLASIAAAVMEHMLRAGPVHVTTRDHDGVVTRLVTTERGIDAALGAAVVGEPVPVADHDVYVGAWRGDLDVLRRRGVRVLSEESISGAPAPSGAGDVESIAALPTSAHTESLR